MRKLFSAVLLSMTLAGTSVMAENATKDQAVALVKEAAAAVKASGKDAVI